MNWIEQGFGVVPTEFQVLVDKLVIDPKLRTDIDRLIAAKRAGEELDSRQRIATIGNFIERELELLEGKQIPHVKRSLPDGQLDELYRRGLANVVWAGCYRFSPSRIGCPFGRNRRVD